MRRLASCRSLTWINAIVCRTAITDRGVTHERHSTIRRPTFGVLGILASVWILVDALNASEANQGRFRLAAYAVTGCIVAAWILGGYWYVNYYYAEKAIILKGPWPFAHNLFMETKEHLFFIPLILALYLPIVAARKLASNAAARAMVVATFIILNGLAIEGAEAIINHGAKVALVHTSEKGAELCPPWPPGRHPSVFSRYQADGGALVSFLTTSLLPDARIGG